MPLISVVMPSYNCAEYLPQAIDSVLSQSLTDFELIVVDDGSVDGTRRVVIPYLADPRVRYIFQDNRGLPGARNTGVKLARGEFIAALDADDALAPTALEEMASALSSSGASWCIIDILKFWEEYREVQRTEIPNGNLLLGILRDDFIRRAMFIRKTVLVRHGMWDERMRMREDWDLNIRLIESGEPFVYLDKPLYEYRRRPGSITTGDPKKLFAYTGEVLTKHHKRIADAGHRTVAEIYAANLWSLARLQLYRRRDLRAAFGCLWKSLRYDFRVSRLFHPILHHLRPNQT